MEIFLYRNFFSALLFFYFFKKVPLLPKNGGAKVIGFKVSVPVQSELYGGWFSENF